MTIVARTTTRVPDHTPERYNRRVEATTAQRVQHYARHPREISARLNELDEEWDIERTLEANAAAVALFGTLLGAFVDRRFLALPAMVSFFLLQHAIQGWCPPVPFFRRRGVRTARESAVTDRGYEFVLIAPGDFWYSGLATGMLGGRYPPSLDRIERSRTRPLLLRPEKDTATTSL